MVRLEFTEQWLRFIRSTLAVDGCLPWDESTDIGFECFGVKWQRLHNQEQATNYIAPTLDHESKHKQEQLGWCGRQWGIINRKALIHDCGDSVSLYGQSVGRIISRFKAVQERRRSKGGEYVGAGVGDHWRLPSVLFGRDADYLADIVRSELPS